MLQQGNTSSLDQVQPRGGALDRFASHEAQVAMIRGHQSLILHSTCRWIDPYPVALDPRKIGVAGEVAKYPN